MQHRLRLLFLAAALFGGCATGSPGDVDAEPSAMDGGDDGAVMTGDAGPPCASDEECEDGVACNGVATCVDSVCRPGTPPACDDGVACTTDACGEPDGACTHVPNDDTCPVGLVCDEMDGCTTPTPCDVDADCDDAQLCNGTERCELGFGCRRGDPETCDDGVGCTMDACDPTGAGACVNAPSDAACDDADACNGAEACDPSAGCAAGAVPDCDDGVSCTVDACDPALGCSNVADHAPCQDGVLCNGPEICDLVAGCIPGPPETCDDGVGCTTGTCDAASDACVQTPNDAMCDDGVACDGVETCDASGATPGDGCAAGAPVDCDDSLSCTIDSCGEPSGTCTYVGVDGDMDGFAQEGCAGGTDCNDSASAVRPGATEVCDGIDNDCTGTADDGSGMSCALGSSAPCSTSCGTAGTAACTALCALGTCRAASETCNACDDDGDGVNDNGLACAMGSSRSCATGCGTTGTQTCNGTCSAYSTCAALEVCNGCDDDGDGASDDGFTCRRGQSRTCTTSCGTTGTEACNASCSGYGACSAGEVCNGCDDDGANGADDGFTCVMGSTLACTTVCMTAGVQTCNASCSAYGACAAPAEICGNSCDDNGNGFADEGCLANDECAGATAISLGAGRATVSGSTATAGNSASSCTGANDVWYSFTLTRTEVVFIHTFGSSYDTFIGMRDGSCGAGTGSCSDNQCSTSQSSITRTLTAGTYYVVVDGSTGASGAFTLTIEHLPVGNDGVARALAAGSSTPGGTTSGTGMLGSTCTLATGAPEHMYYWTQCPSAAGGSFSASTCSRASWDTAVYLMSGATGASLFCSDDFCSLQSSISATVDGGAGLFGLYVDGYYTGSGAYPVAVTRP